MSFFIFLNFAIKVLSMPFSEHFVFLILLIFCQGLYFPYFSHLFFNISWICHQFFLFLLESNQMLSLPNKIKTFIDCCFSPFIHNFLKLYQLVFPFLQLFNPFHKWCLVDFFHDALDNLFHFRLLRIHQITTELIFHILLNFFSVMVQSKTHIKCKSLICKKM